MNTFTRLVCGVMLLVLFTGVRSDAGWSRSDIEFKDHQLPKSLTLCNEPVPLEDRVVREMLEREFIISVWDPAQVILWLKRANRYFPYIEKKLAEAGMPDDLKYVAVAESALLTHGRSSKGALGPWQFMRHTAHRNGLRKNRSLDERLNFELSTQSAINHLKRLHKMFDSWTLALAAYNCGEARLKKEIRHQKVTDYFRLNLPLETERYVFRIAAAKIIIENPELYGYRLPPQSLYEPIECDTIEITIHTPLHITDIAQALGTDFKVIRELNPQLLGYYLTYGKHGLKVPPGMGPKALEVISGLSRTALSKKAKTSSDHYIVQPDDTLSHISIRTGVSVDALQELNDLKNSVIYVGQKLRLRP